MSLKKGTRHGVTEYKEKNSNISFHETYYTIFYTEVKVPFIEIYHHKLSRNLPKNAKMQ